MVGITEEIGLAAVVGIFITVAQIRFGTVSDLADTFVARSVGIRECAHVPASGTVVSSTVQAVTIAAVNFIRRAIGSAAGSIATNRPASSACTHVVANTTVILVVAEIGLAPIFGISVAIIISVVAILLTFAVHTARGRVRKGTLVSALATVVVVCCGLDLATVNVASVAVVKSWDATSNTTAFRSTLGGRRVVKFAQAATSVVYPATPTFHWSLAASTVIQSASEIDFAAISTCLETIPGVCAAALVQGGTTTAFLGRSTVPSA